MFDLYSAVAAAKNPLAIEKQERKLARSAFESSTSKALPKTAAQASWHAVPPEMYHKAYNKLPKINSPADRDKLFINGTSVHNNSLISRKANEVLPGIFSFDPMYLKFQKVLRDTLNKEFQAEIDDNFFSSNGLETNFDNLTAVSGYFQNPLSYTIVDNQAYIEYLGLRSKLTEREKQIAKNVWRIFFRRYKVKAINVPKLSTSGVRRFTHDVQWKLAFSRFVMEPGNFELVLQLVAKRDYCGLATLFEIVFMTYIQKRGQVDKVGKVRKVFDLLYAQSAGREGHIIETDKRVVIDGIEYDASAMRARVIHAGPWTVNCVLQVVFTGHLHNLFDEFPLVFGINTPDQLKSRFDGYYVQVSDVGNYDISISRKQMEMCHEVMSEFWDQRLCDMSWLLITSPYYSRPVTPDGKEGIWFGNPLEDSYIFAGNRSGHAGTSSFAKICKTIETMCVIDRITPLVGREEEFLLDGLGWIYCNNGDDEGVAHKSKVLFNRYTVLRQTEGYLDVTPEVGQAYSGMLLVKENPNVNIYKPQPRIPSALEKIFVPERGIDSKMRRFWPIGMQVRLDTLSNTSDMSRAVLDVTLKVFEKELGNRFGSFKDIVTLGAQKMGSDMSGYSYDEKILVDNPDYGYYRDTSSMDIRDSVVEELYSKIPPVQFEHILKNYYGGTIH